MTWRVTGALIGMLLAVVACTATVDTSSTVASGPALALQPTTTTAATEPTTLPADSAPLSQDVSRSWAVKVDPRTLQGIPGFDPIGVGDGGWGFTSPSGRWLFLVTWREHVADEFVLIDTETWSVSRFSPWGTPIGVNDDGTLYTSRKHPDLLIRSREVGSDTWAPVAQFGPGSEFPGEPVWIDHRRLGGLGRAFHTVEGNTVREPFLFVVDAVNGSVSQIPLPGVTWGSSPNLDESESPVEQSYAPGVAWGRDVGYVVHADQEVVTSVDLRTGGITHHSYAPRTSLLEGLLAWLIPPANAKGPSPGLRINATLSPDGSHLFVSGYRSEVYADSEGRWRESTKPIGVTIINTETWTTEARLAVPVGQIQVSPDGSALLGTGFTEEGTTPGGFRFTGSGVYIISTSTHTYTHLDQGSDWETQVELSGDGRHAYLTYSLAETNLTYFDVVDLANLEVIASRDGIRLQLWGSAGVISEWVGG